MKSYVSIVAPIEHPTATFFLVGVPSIGCQDATSTRCGSRTGGCRSVMVTSGEGWSGGSSGRWQLTVNSQLATSVDGPRHSVKGHFEVRLAHAHRRGGAGTRSTITDG